MNLRLHIDGEVLGWWWRGGIPRLYAELLPRAAAADPELDLVVSLQGRLSPHSAGVVPAVRRVPRAEAWRPWRLWRRAAPRLDPWLAARYWRRQAGDVFHPTHYSAPEVDMPSFCFVYDMTPELFPDGFEPGFARRMAERKRRAITRAHRLLCISENTKRDVMRLLGAPEEKCCVVYLAPFTRAAAGIRLRCESPTTRASAGQAEPGPASSGGPPSVAAGAEPFLLYVGDFYAPYKQFRFLLQCLGSAEFAAYRDLRLVVVSSRAPSADEQREFSALLPAGRLRFVAGASDEELLAHYRRCAALVYPSLYEGFGMPVLEALEVGAPVVCPYASSLPEVAGETAFYYEAASPAGLREALGRALASGRSADAVAARQRRAARFTWEATTAAFIATAREVAAEGRP